MIRGDYLERLIEQAVQALARILRLREAGELDQARGALDATVDLVLGPFREVVERLEASAAALVVGRPEIDRIRAYAALVAEEAELYEQAGDLGTADQRRRRALDLYRAATQAGAQLTPDDVQRMSRL